MWLIKTCSILFPEAKIYSDRREPGYWDSVSIYDSNQVYIVIAGKFFASESEMKKLIAFVEHGNDVFISACIFLRRQMLSSNATAVLTDLAYVH